ncbi:MAG TPA: RNA polymerase sigma factor [Gammaproteobacteria bacterium]
MSIINLFRNREKSADRFECLLRPHIDPMYRFAYRLCGASDDAEELVQVFLTRLFPKLERIEKIDKLLPWLCRGLYNLYVDGYRRQQREITIFDTDEQLYEGSDDTDTTFIGASSAELSSQIESALEQLNPDQRLVVLLHDSEGYTLEELSQILRVPLGTLKSRLNRAHKVLTKLLQTEPFGDPVRVRDIERRNS